MRKFRSKSHSRNGCPSTNTKIRSPRISSRRKKKLLILLIWTKIRSTRPSLASNSLLKRIEMSRIFSREVMMASSTLKLTLQKCHGNIQLDPSKSNFPTLFTQKLTTQDLPFSQWILQKPSSAIFKILSFPSFLKLLVLIVPKNTSETTNRSSSFSTPTICSSAIGKFTTSYESH